jgi:PAS domain S-box-containing protein
MDDIPREPAAMRSSRFGDPLRLVAHIPSGITVLSLDYRILFANPAYGRLLGYLPDELIGRPIAGLIHPEDWPRDRAAVGALQGGATDEVTVAQRHLRRDGAAVLLQSRLTPLRDRDGAIEALLAVVVPLEEGAASAAPFPGAAAPLPVAPRFRHEGAALHQLALVLARADSPWSALDRASVITQRLFQATAVAIALVKGADEGGPAERAEPAGVLRVSPAAFGPLARRLLARQRPLLAQATGGARPLPPDLCAQLGLSRCTSLMLLPLRHPRRTALGVLAIGARRPRAPFQASDVHLAGEVALLVAAALRSAYGVELIRQRAAQEERARIAGELHASAIQALYGMMLMAKGWAQQSEQDRLPDPAHHLRQLAEIAHTTLQTLLAVGDQHTTD